ncbi:hypothetical protein ACOSP7_023718 [Xanthoceras sorbifolium]
MEKLYISDPTERMDLFSVSNGSNNAHVLLVSYPAQGHVAPFMKLSHLLSACGAKVTLVTTQSKHARIVDQEQGPVSIVSVPDGLESEDDRKDVTKLSQSIIRVMPAYVEELIKKINQNEEQGDQKITCVVADSLCGWALELAGKFGIKRAMFFTAAPGSLALTLHIPKLIQAGIINLDGAVRKNDNVELSPNLPTLSPAEFMWNNPGHPSLQKIMFEYVKSVNQTVELSDWVLCNWFQGLDPSADHLLPNIIPVGPLLANGKPSGNFWSEDLTCLSWLDRQPPGSVIYAAFGSTSVFSQHQFNELALGLELVGRPFLWVVRPDLSNGNSNDYPNGFTQSVANIGRMVQWAPQEKVLAHPSLACYLTHCGWNSTMEGLSMGVPFLCWPYCADQFYNKSCICEDWKVGLCLSKDENGIITRHEIKKKVEELLSSDGIRKNALNMKALAQESVSPGGSSSKSLEYFVNQIKG